MKKFILATAGAFLLFGAQAPALAQTMTQVTDCDQASWAACGRECGRRQLSDSAYAGCMVGCGIATGCG